MSQSLLLRPSTTVHLLRPSLICTRPRRTLHCHPCALPRSTRLSAARSLYPFGEPSVTPPRLRRTTHSNEAEDARERRLREWRRQRQQEADEVVLLPAEVAAEQRATRGAPETVVSLTASAPPLSVADPDARYRTDDDSTRASLLAFAELEGRLRAKQALKDAADTAVAAMLTAADSTVPDTQPAASTSDDELVSSSMDAFAALELQLAKKRLQRKQEYLSDPASRTTSQTVATASPQPQQLTVLTAPRMPEPQECCGMSCPNCVRLRHLISHRAPTSTLPWLTTHGAMFCRLRFAQVWIVYAEQLAEFELQKARLAAGQTQPANA